MHRTYNDIVEDDTSIKLESYEQNRDQPSSTQISGHLAGPTEATSFFFACNYFCTYFNTKSYSNVNLIENN